MVERRSLGLHLLLTGVHTALLTAGYVPPLVFNILCSSRSPVFDLHWTLQYVSDWTKWKVVFVFILFVRRTIGPCAVYRLRLRVVFGTQKPFINALYISHSCSSSYQVSITYCLFNTGQAQSTARNFIIYLRLHAQLCELGDHKWLRT